MIVTIAEPTPAQAGAGAAGGLGFAFLTFFHATLESGVNIILEETHLSDYIKNADGIISNILPAWSRLGKNREQSCTLFRQNSTETFFQICLNCGIMIYKAQVSHILDSLKIMWDWPQDIWRNLVSKGDAAEYSMQWKQMEASIRVIFT